MNYGIIIHVAFGPVAQLGEQVIRKAGPDHLTTCTKQILKTEQIPQLGGVAQLGEQVIRKAGPDLLTTCTKKNPKIEQIPQLGGVAQLGERTVRIRKVESSILFVSTMKTAKSNDLAVFS